MRVSKTLPPTAIAIIVATGSFSGFFVEVAALDGICVSLPCGVGVPGEKIVWMFCLAFGSQFRWKIWKIERS